MKKYGFFGNRVLYGVLRNYRFGGLIGMLSWFGKVLKGKKMVG